VRYRGGCDRYFWKVGAFRDQMVGGTVATSVRLPPPVLDPRLNSLS
jgi:hypothetical protein